MTVIVDTSAVMALLRGEKGRERVIEALGNAVMSTVNYAEVIGRQVMRGMPVALAKVQFESLRLPTIGFDDDQAVEAGNLRLVSHHLQLSLADRACLALARLRKLPVLTSDRKWSELEIGVDIRQIR